MRGTKQRQRCKRNYENGRSVGGSSSDHDLSFGRQDLRDAVLRVTELYPSPMFGAACWLMSREIFPQPQTAACVGRRETTIAGILGASLAEQLLRKFRFWESVLRSGRRCRK